MRLSSLTLNGFKSFADKTVFTFDDDITCVVGPNGCGKSNVVDAVKWVLGERSSKSLRGKEMIDVIFAGSAGRKPSGMAQVVLSFENPVIDANASMEELVIVDEVESDPASEIAEPGAPRLVGKRALPIDTEEVHVERRLYRDGTSQYRINDRRVRLRDVRELFMDTGIGADAYSIIEQGKVDAMLLASPTERRTIFEEAAGVAKYKQRRIEALRKLERTEVNLTRAREQLDATERRLRLVQGQAAKARTFVELDEEFRAIRAALAFDQYDDLNQRLEGLTSRIHGLESERTEAESAVRTLESEKHDADVAKQSVAESLKAAEREQMACEHDAQQHQQRAVMLERSIEQSRERVDRDRASLSELHARIEESEQLEQEQSTLATRLDAEVAEAEQGLEQSGEARAAVLESLAERRGIATEARTAVSNISRERASLQAGLDADQRRLGTLRDQLGKIGQKRHTAGEELEAARERSTTLRSQADAAKLRSGQLAEQLESLVDRVGTLEADKRQLSKSLGDREQHLARLESRRATLEEMVESREGYADVVKDVLAIMDRGEGFAGVRGVLGELIEATTEHAGAVELALGSTLQGLVIEALSNVGELESLPGRLMLLPIESVSAVPGSDASRALLEQSSGRVVALRDQVSSADAGVGQVLDRLLSETYLVESVDAAMLLATGPLGTRARFVTRSGEVIESDGRVSAGPVGELASAGLLARRNELVELSDEIDQLVVEVRGRRAELADVDEQAAELSGQRARIQSERSEQDRAHASLEAQADRAQAERDRLESTGSELEREYASVGERIGEIEAEQAETRSRVEKLADLERDQSEKAERLEAELAQLDIEAEHSGEAVAAARVRVSQAREQRSSAGRELERVRREIEQARRQSENLARHIEDAIAASAQERASVEESRQQSEQAKERIEVLAASCQELRDQANAAALAAAEIGERLGEARVIAERVLRDWHAVESGRRELEIRREHLEDQVLDDLAIDLALEYLDYRATIAPGDVVILDREPSEARVAELGKAIKKLGNVNLDAIEEEGQLAERNDDLIAQVEDLDSARGQLMDLISKLNVTSEKLFKETFETVREHFAAPDGMFRKLFGGGKAEVRLMPLVKEIDGEKVQTDEIDWLESGVEVIARPPGKEPRSINQLSGGEKTMTAVALLLSIFQSKPSCFCVLDEVDAALDDANVERYCRVVREFTDSSHFIVITHNKRTMAEADRLFGVTMQERGVSKRVSVRVDDVGQDGSISSSVEREPRGGLKDALASMRAGTDTPVSAS